MPALATTHSLNNYPRLSITSYRDQLRQAGKANKIDLNYKYRNQSYSYSINLTKTACNYGNYRYWWLCPNCSKRVSVLYCAGAYVCRHCIGGKYGSQLEQPIDNLFRRLNTIRARLGWQAGIIHGIGDRPKGMHRTTYNKIMCEYMNLVERALGAQRKMLNLD